MSVLVLVAPGQGAQSPGFLNPWLELPGVADLLGSWSEVVELDLVRYGTIASAEEIVDTAVAQPLLVAAGLLSARALLDGDTASEHDTKGDTARYAALAPGALAGHSVGELTVAALAGVITDEEALALVRRRGLAMAEVAAVTETGMSAILGGDPETVVAHLEKLGLTAANINGAGQIVAAGTLEELAALSADKPEKARVRPLKVAGAFHTVHMEHAVTVMRKAVSGLTPGKPRFPLVSNADGQVVTDGAEFMERLVRQLANPVRWDLCMDTFTRQGATAMIEVCPGGTLAGIAKRAMPGVSRVALKTPADLDAARALVTEHDTAN